MLPRHYTMIHVIIFVVWVSLGHCDKAVFIKKYMGSIGNCNVTIASGGLMYVWRYNRSTAVYFEIAPAPRDGNMMIYVN